MNQRRAASSHARRAARHARKASCHKGAVNSRRRVYPRKNLIGGDDMFRKLLPVFLLAVMGAAPVPATRGEAKSGEVMVLATLYRRHENVSVYDLSTLRKIVVAFRPDVLVLDVTPSELKEGKVHPSKIEYTEVIFPLLKNGGYRVYPAEPSEPMFSEIVNAVKNAINAFELENPAAAKEMRQLNTSAYESLKAYWRTPAEVNDNVTDRMLMGKTVLEHQLNGVAKADNGRWNQHTVSMVQRAVRENPGKRLLVLNGIENCYWIRDALSRDSRINLVKAEQWLRDHNLELKSEK
jgi:hypothetical protein